jgi:hypothetical protein
MSRKRSVAAESMMPLITMSFTPPGTGDTMSLAWAVLDGQPESSDWIGLFRSGSDEKVLQHRICCKNEQKGGIVSSHCNELIFPAHCVVCVSSPAV